MITPVETRRIPQMGDLPQVKRRSPTTFVAGVATVESSPPCVQRNSDSYPASSWLTRSQNSTNYQPHRPQVLPCRQKMRKYPHNGRVAPRAVLTQCGDLLLCRVFRLVKRMLSGGSTQNRTLRGSRRAVPCYPDPSGFHGPWFTRKEFRRAKFPIRAYPRTLRPPYAQIRTGGP